MGGNNNQGRINIPFGGSGGGGISIGGNGLGIQLPGSGGEISRPGPIFNIPISPPQPPRPPRPSIQSSLPHPYPPSYPPIRPQQPQFVRPAPAPASAPPALPAPPTNTVVTNVKPPLNDLDLRKHWSVSRNPEAAARVEGEALGGVDDSDTELDALIGAAGKGDAIDDWHNMKKPRSTADVDKFMKDHPDIMNGELKSTLEVRQEFSKFADDVRDGRLTDQGKMQRIDELKALVKTEAAKPGANAGLLTSLDGRVDAMKNFQIMGQIADAVQGTNNPFPPLVQGAIQIGMPPIFFVSELTGVPVLPVEPVGNLSGAWPGSGAVILYNPADNGQSVSYLLDSHNFSMAPGQQQRLDRSYQVSFDSGVGSGAKKFQVANGVYEWRLESGSGWNLYKVPVKATIDNSRYDGVFQYLLNNQRKSVGPGEIVEHASDAPLQIAFDPGNGGAEVRKLLKSGRYVVGVNPKVAQLDLFGSDKVEEAMSEAPDYVSSTRVAGAGATQAERVDALLAQLRRSSGRSSVGAERTGVSPIGGAPQRKASVDDLLKSLGSGGSAGN